MDRIRRALDLSRDKHPPRDLNSEPVIAVIDPRGVIRRSVETSQITVADAAAQPGPNEAGASHSGASFADQHSQGKTAAEILEPEVRATGLAGPSSSPRASSGPAETSPTYEASTATKLPTAIQYTKTKTFSPSMAWLESNRVVDVSGSDAAAAAFRILRTQVLQRMSEHDWRSIAVLSPGSNDGKTTTAINLAISLANDQRHTVLLVEFDLTRPIIAKRLGIDAQVGVDDVLRGSAGVAESLYHPEGFDRFVVMPARARMEQSSEMLAGPRCREIVKELRARYPDRLLVFDLPPLMGADDALAFMPLVECTLIVVAEGSTPRANLLRCMELLRNTPVVGTVLNLSTDTGSAYG